MLDRYTNDTFSTLWSRSNVFQKWLDVEIAVCQAKAEAGEIPQADFNAIQAGSKSFNVVDIIDRIDEIERETHHDVIAFLTAVNEKIGPSSRFIHKGMTSSDVIDTAMSLLLVEAGEIIADDLENLRIVLKNKATAYKDLVCMGRSHGIHGEPITMGLKFLSWYDEMVRNQQRFQATLEGMRIGQISGPMGNFVNVSPAIEKRALALVGLRPAPISTQIINRDIHAQFFSTLAIIASSLERFCVEIRHLQRTEVLEVEEAFAKGQKGSSAMPHKKNPIGSENISGLARVIRSNAQAALENIPLWHERDISHSSVERIIAPDSTALTDFILKRFSRMVENLVIYPENIQNNIDKSYGLFFSQSVMLALTEKGLSREAAYAIVQENAMQAWEQKKSFRSFVDADCRITEKLSISECDALFDMGKYTAHVDAIFNRVFTEV